MKNSDKIQTKAGSIYLQTNGILRIEIAKTDEITISNVKEFLEVIKELGEGKAFCNLIVVKDFIHIDSETRKFNASEEANMYTIAEALIIKSSALRIVGNFYIRFNKPTRPTRIFTRENEATTWLKTFI